MYAWNIVSVTFTLFIALFSFITTDAVFHCDSSHGRYQCPNGGRCITTESVCDFRNDCSDGADEKNCTHPPCNGTSQFLCKNGKCIHNSWKCDKQDDCFDNSDEEESLCHGHYCRGDQFLCHRSDQCIQLTNKCDTEIDCDDGEDEEGCPPPTCEESERMCDDGRECQDKEYFCDGEEDCDDGSDEQHCDGTICAENMFSCADGSECRPEVDRCDGLRDCRDGSDEADCSKDHVNSCLPGYFACRSGFCLPDLFRCNGHTDCPDHSDEVGCQLFKETCPHGKKLCTNRRQCVNDSLWCDGARDCIDNSDEAECGDHHRPDPACHHETHFRCTNGKCIDARQVCNGINNCDDGDDGDDEPFLCKHNECQIANGNCSHICKDLKIGYECSCPTGYKLKDDRLACEDIDECKTIDNNCVGVCENVEGSYRCFSSGKEAKVNFVVADRDKILNLTMQLHQISQPLISDISVSSVAVDVANQFIYWSNPRAETISRAKLSDLSNEEILLSRKDVEDPTNLAIDWVHGLLFWVDSSPSSVSVISLEKPDKPKTLLKPRNSAISSIAVHPKYGFLYVGSEQLSGSGKLERCGMDGQNCSILFDTKIGVPIDIAIDFEFSHLYWIDEQLRILVISNLDGSERTNVDIGAHLPISLAVFGKRVYFVDGETRRIVSTNRRGGDIKQVKEGLSLNADLAVYEASSQIEGQNQCSGNRCPGLCLPTISTMAYAGYSCVCPDGFLISKTNSCTPKPTSTPPTSTTVSTTSTNKISTTADGPLTTSTNRTETNAASGSSPSAVLVVGIIAIFVLLIGIFCLMLRYRRQRSARMSMNFNNPIYRKMNERPPSGSSFPGLTEPSPTTSSGNVSNNSNDGTAALVLNEEQPDVSKPTFRNVSGLKIVNDGIYTEIPCNDVS